MTIELMVQGTTSDAGKSTLVAGLCRALFRKGYPIAPFKPQNMALNSAVTKDGGEIGRAQALQAQACGLEPHTDFNPILLKPNTDIGAQVIVQGKALSDMDAVDYHNYKTTAMAAVLDSYHRLKQQYDIVITEGAGSPAEINLRDRDIANMGFAETVDCPVIIIADIDRGGVFAHLVGTLALLSESEQHRVIGFVINRFRGDYALLKPGIDWLEQHTGKPVLGTLPYLPDLHLEAEDAINVTQTHDSNSTLKVCVPVLQRISNHTDFDALRLHPQVDLQFIPPGKSIEPCDLIILPGSKSVRSDLAFIHEQGWSDTLHKHLRYGGKVLGICGGFQMLGNSIDDPYGIEGEPGQSIGLGLLDIQTNLEKDKQLKQVAGELIESHAGITGYEIHAGQSTGPGLQRPFAKLNDGFDGAISDDEQIIGTYVHGLFDNFETMSALLTWAGLTDIKEINHHQEQEKSLNRLAECVESHIDIDHLLELIKR